MQAKQSVELDPSTLISDPSKKERKMIKKIG
jgi:hypothetical protein